MSGLEADHEFMAAAAAAAAADESLEPGRPVSLPLRAPSGWNQDSELWGDGGRTEVLGGG